MHIRTVITFDQIKKLDDKGNFDLPATLGEFVKLTYNQHPSETLPGNAKIRIRGNLRVEICSVHIRVIRIESDNLLDSIPLQWLEPWLGAVEQLSENDYFAVSVDLQRFERQFILPFVAEFTAHLSGRHPLDYLMFKNFNGCLNLLASERHSFDAKATHCLDEKTGNVELTLRDGTKLIGSDQIKVLKEYSFIQLNRSFCLLAMLERAKKAELRTLLHEGQFIETATAEMERYFVENNISRDEKPVSPEEKNFHSFYLLGAIYRKFKQNMASACLFEPFRKELVNRMTHVVLPAMSTETLIGPHTLYGPASELNGSYFYSGPTPIDNLIELGDEDILKSVLDEVKKRKLDINFLGYHTTPLLSLTGAKGLSFINKRLLLNLLFDAGLKLTPELANEVRFWQRQLKHEWTVDEIQAVYDARFAVPETACQTQLTVIPIDEYKPLVNFNQAAKFDEEKKLDVAATIGDIIKQTLNQAQDQQPFCGTLTVTCHEDKIKIHSNDAKDDLSRLMLFLGGDSELCSDERLKTPNEFLSVELHLLDRHFICPYLADFRKHLKGKHPLESFLLKEFVSFLKAQGINLAERPPYLHENTGELIVTFQDGLVTQGCEVLSDRLRGENIDCSLVEMFKIFILPKQFAFVFEKEGIEKLFVTDALETVQIREGCGNEREYQLVFMLWLFDQYDDVFNSDEQVSSLWIDIRKAFETCVLCSLMPTVRLCDMKNDAVRAGLSIANRAICNGILTKVREANVDLNTFLDEHPLLWIASVKRPRVVPVDKIQWIVQRLFEEGLVMTNEVMEQSTLGNIAQKETELFMSEFFLHYKRMMDVILPFLSGDTASTVMRYLVCDDFVNKVVKVLPSTVERASQNRNSFLTIMTEAGSPGSTPLMSPDNPPLSPGARS